MSIKGNENIFIEGNDNKVVHLHLHVEHLEITELNALIEKLKSVFKDTTPLTEGLPKTDIAHCLLHLRTASHT